MSDQPIQPGTITTGLSEEQLVVSSLLPAVYANRFSVVANEEIVKITFYEQASPNPEKSVPRASLAIGFKACEMLAKMLTDVPKAAQKK